MQRIPSPTERTSASPQALNLLTYAEARGFSRAAAAAHFGLDLVSLGDVDGRLPTATLARMWNELPALVGDPDMPLHVITHAATAEPPLTVLVFLASPTLGDAIRRLARYERVTIDVADDPVSEIVVDGEHSHIVLHHERSAVLPPTGAVIDAMLGILMLARMGTQRALTPASILLRHPRPRRSADYSEAFGCDVTFDGERDRMTWRTSDLALPHPESSRTLLSIVERHAQQTLERLPRGDDPLGELRLCIRETLPEGQTATEHFARRQGVGTRTLQRRLKEAGTSIRKLMDEERRSLALHHIQNPKTALVEIAFLLGFADQSAFTRAFARWTGRSPRDYRQSLL